MQPQDEDLENPDLPEVKPGESGKNAGGGPDTKHQLNQIDQASIFVRNLEENTTEEDLKEFFKDCGTIVKTTMRTDKITGTQYAYIQFQEVASVDDALVLSDGIIRGRKI